MRCGAPSLVVGRGLLSEVVVVPRRAPSRRAGRIATRTYRIPVSGIAPVEPVRAALADSGIDSRHLLTVLVGRVEGHDALLSLLRRLRGRGLTILEVRRMPAGAIPSTRTGSEERWLAADGALEVTTAQPALPAVRRALEPYVAALAELHAAMCGSGAPGHRCVELELRLETRGMLVASIAAMHHRREMPASRTAGRGRAVVASE